MNAREFYYQVIAPEEEMRMDLLRRRSRQALFPRKERNYLTKLSDKEIEDRMIQRLNPEEREWFYHEAILSNDFMVETYFKGIIHSNDEDLQERLEKMFIATRNNFSAKAIARANDGDYQGDLIFLYLGLPTVCEQYMVLFTKFLTLHMMKHEEGYDRKKASELTKEITSDIINLSMAQLKWKVNDSYIELDKTFTLWDRHVLEEDFLSMNLRQLTLEFVLCHEIAHHLLGHTGNLDDGSQYIQRLPKDLQFWVGTSDAHSREFQADALAILLLSGRTKTANTNSRLAKKMLNDAMLGCLLTLTVLGKITINTRGESNTHPSIKDRYIHCLAIIKYLAEKDQELLFEDVILRFRITLSNSMPRIEKRYIQLLILGYILKRIFAPIKRILRFLKNSFKRG